MEVKKVELRELDEKVTRLREEAARESYAAVRHNTIAESAQHQVDLLESTMTTARLHLMRYALACRPCCVC